MAALFVDSLAALERAVSLPVMQNIFGVCLPGRGASALWQLM